MVRKKSGQSNSGTRTITDWLYLWGICLFPLLIAGFLFVHLVERDSLCQPTCILYGLTGLYCPGCGGTRAVIALFDGKILESIWYHPLVPYTIGLYLIFMVSQTLERWKVPLIKGLRYKDIYLYLAIGIICVNFVLKNILTIFFDIHM